MIVSRDLDTYACPQTASISEILARINGSDFLFQVVVDEDGHPVGTVTDGDIRRALVRGVALDATARDVMFRQPTIERESRLEQARAQLLARSISFLPLTDDDGRLSAFLVNRPKQQMPAAMIMAGGFGQRLGPRTQKTPKPLLPVGGQPILGRILDQLESAAVTDIYISVHYKPEQFREFIAGRDNKASITIIEETSKLGTAGAISLIAHQHDGPLFVLNGDILTRTDLGSMATFHDSHDHDLTMAVARYEVSIPYGVVSFSENGEFSHIDEKPTVPFQVGAGLYLLSPGVRKLVPAEAQTDMPTVFNQAKELGMKVGVFPIVEYWRDIGRPSDLDAADEEHS